VEARWDRLEGRQQSIASKLGRISHKSWVTHDAHSLISDAKGLTSHCRSRMLFRHSVILVNLSSLPSATRGSNDTVIVSLDFDRLGLQYRIYILLTVALLLQSTRTCLDLNATVQSFLSNEIYNRIIESYKPKCTYGTQAKRASSESPIFFRRHCEA